MDVDRMLNLEVSSKGFFLRDVVTEVSTLRFEHLRDGLALRIQTSVILKERYDPNM